MIFWDGFGWVECRFCKIEFEIMGLFIDKKIIVCVFLNGN